jgi:hypothetical protein
LDRFETKIEKKKKGKGKSKKDSDNLFIAGEGTLLQWSIANKKVVKDFGDLMDSNEIWALEITADKKSLFIAGIAGFLKQIDIDRQEVAKDFGQIHDFAIWALAATHDGHFHYTSDDQGYLQK